MDVCVSIDEDGKPRIWTHYYPFHAFAPLLRIEQTIDKKGNYVIRDKATRKPILIIDREGRIRIQYTPAICNKQIARCVGKLLNEIYGISFDLYNVRNHPHLWVWTLAKSYNEKAVYRFKIDSFFVKEIILDDRGYVISGATPVGRKKKHTSEW